MIGLTGAHRTGKTTLARTFALEIGIPFAETSSSAVIQSLGYSVQEELPFRERIEVQNAILDDAIEKWGRYRGQAFVTDRTPLDMLAYTMADIRRDTLDSGPGSLDHQYILYRNRCLQSCMETFKLLAHIPPGITPAADLSKAQITIGYIEHIYLIISGLMTAPMPVHKFRFGDACLDLNERVSQLKKAWETVMEHEIGTKPEKSAMN